MARVTRLHLRPIVDLEIGESESRKCYRFLHRHLWLVSFWDPFGSLLNGSLQETF